MFGFIKKVFVIATTFFSCSALKCVSMNNQECKIRPVVMNINRNETLFYPYSILVNKCSGSCNDINNFYTKLCEKFFLMLLKTKMLKYSIKVQGLIKQVMYIGMKLVNVNID